MGRKRQLLALDHLNLTVNRGEVLGLVGESGCGKSTLARVVMGVYPPSAGEVYYDAAPLCLKIQSQRIGIARALAVGPELLICDEPISALDISVRSQIINLLAELKVSLQLTYLFISHDLNVVRHISDRIAVMYAGRIVELGDAQAVYEAPRHPYTQMLLRSVLRPMPDRERLTLTTGEEEAGNSLLQPESGCPFALRCPAARDICRQVAPELKQTEAKHWVACHGMGW